MTIPTCQHMMRTPVAALLALGCGIALALVAAQAYSVSPLRIVLEPIGKDAQARMRIDNPGTQPVTLSLSVERLDIDERGGISSAAADADFLIFPPQTILDGGKSQAIQVRYVGAADIQQGVVYMLTTEQVPVDLDSSDNAAIKIGLNFGTVIHVIPPGATPDLSAVMETTEGDGALVRITNAGAAQTSLADYKLVGGGSELPLEETDLGDAVSIMPRGDRLVAVPAGLFAPGAPLSVEPAG